MVDIFSPEKRSWVMSRVKGKNNLMEKNVFSHLRKNGIYFQKHYNKAPGSPDIALPRKKICVFIDGDFGTVDELKAPIINFLCFDVQMF